MTTSSMSNKEMEASISLLYMTQSMDIPTAANGLEKKFGNHDVLLDSLVEVVAKEASGELTLLPNVPQKKNRQRSARLSALSRELTLEKLRPHFGRPIVDVARAFGICTTFLKKICRRCGIKRWPHRQIRSLNRTIEMLEHVQSLANDPLDKTRYAKQIIELKEKQRAVLQNPDANSKLKRIKRFSTLKGATDVFSMGGGGQLPDCAKTTNCPNATSSSVLAVAVDTVSSGVSAQIISPKQKRVLLNSYALDMKVPATTLSLLTTPLHGAESFQLPSALKISPSNHKLLQAKCNASDRPFIFMDSVQNFASEAAYN
ncbi:putative RWP-RK domain-containing protein [Plasmopara halstedii]